MLKQQAKSLAAAAWCVQGTKETLYLGSDSRSALTTPARASVTSIRFANPEAGT